MAAARSVSATKSLPVFNVHVDDDSSHWQFALLDVGAEHQMALGIRDAHAAARPFEIRMREIVPDPAANARHAATPN